MSTYLQAIQAEYNESEYKVVKKQSFPSTANKQAANEAGKTSRFFIEFCQLFNGVMAKK